MILHEQYYEWLLFKVTDPKEPRTHDKLFRELASAPFKATVGRDDNWFEHCEYMREDYYEEAEFEGAEYVKEDGEITLLEVMVNLCIKAEGIMQGFDGVDCERWFNDMLENSGLIFYTDYRFSKTGVWSKINRILDREYNRDGGGGLFCIPVLDPSHDLRDVELWYQLMWYIDYVNDYKEA